MSISLQYTFNPSADAVVRQALQFAGLLPLGRRPRAEQLADARDMLTTMLKALQNKGIMLTTAERVTLALTPGTASYNLDADTIDVEFPTTWTPAGSTSEQIVERMSYSDYAPLSDKAAQGTPTRVYVEKSSLLTATFWNVPSAAGTWHYRRVRLIRDASDGGVTLDVTARYLEAIVWKMAYRMALANSVSLERVKYLRDEAQASQDETVSDDNERGDCNLILTDVYGRR
jgi:hypothetical protein